MWHSLLFARTLALFGASLVIVICSSAAKAQSWSGNDWMSPMGLHTASISVQKHEFSLQISCDESAQENLKLSFMFAGPALPRLYGTDGQEETLLLSFVMPGSPALNRRWNAYYYDGGLGDQAWLGDVKSDEKLLVAFSRAQTISILNMNEELIYRFPAKGTSVATKLLRDTCGLGQKW